MKTIICVSGRSNIGKTETIRTVWKKLKSPKKTLLGSCGNDILGKLTIKGHLVGCETLGDPKSNQREWIEILIKLDCEVIVCAARTHGETLDNVVELAAEHDYRIIYVSPCITPDSNYFWLKDMSADMIVDLIKKSI